VAYKSYTNPYALTARHNARKTRRCRESCCRAVARVHLPSTLCGLLQCLMIVMLVACSTSHERAADRLMRDAGSADGQTWEPAAQDPVAVAGTDAQPRTQEPSSDANEFTLDARVETYDADALPGTDGSSTASAPIDGSACMDFAVLWGKALSTFGVARTTGQLDQCATCVAASISHCSSTAGSMSEDCGPTDRCIERNCICPLGATYAEGSDCEREPVPSDLCGCIESCLPTSDSICQMWWNSYQNCMVAQCGSDCFEPSGSP